MISRLLLAALLALLPLGAEAANCSSNPFTLTNGQTADATQVMANFNNLLNCSNNNLAHNGANSDITSLSGLSTPLSVPQGGTGATSFTATAGLLTGNGTSAFSSIAPSTSGNLLQSNGAAWVSANTLTGPYAFTGAVNHQATLTMSGAAFNEAQATDLASAGAMDLGAVAGNYVRITGTTTITNFTPAQAGTRRTLRFLGALTLSHSNPQIILPGAANIQTAVNDIAVFVSEGGGNWTCVSYIRASGGATKAQMQAGTDPFSPVTPAQANQADGAAKAWAEFNGTGPTLNAAFNIASLVRNGAGDYTVTFTTPFSSALYVMAGSARTTSGSGDPSCMVSALTAPTASAMRVFCVGGAGDPTQVNLVFFGRQ